MNEQRSAKEPVTDDGLGLSKTSSFGVSAMRQAPNKGGGGGGTTIVL